MKKRLILIASLVCGLLAAVLTRAYLAGVAGEVARERAALNARYGTLEVLVFKKDTAGGTVLEKSDLGLMDVPALGMRGQALTHGNLMDVIGRKVLATHRRGEVLFWSDIEGGDARRRGISDSVKRMMRAMSVNVSGAASVSGMVKPNDHVDVIGTFAFPQPDGKVAKGDIVTCTMLQNVLVLATGQETADAFLGRREGGAYGRPGYSTVTLEVTPREAEMLAFAEQMKGRLVLTLRNRSDSSYERELPKVDFEKIRSEIEALNLSRQQKVGGR